MTPGFWIAVGLIVALAGVLVWWWITKPLNFRLRDERLLSNIRGFLDYFEDRSSMSVLHSPTETELVLSKSCNDGQITATVTVRGKQLSADLSSRLRTTLLASCDRVDLVQEQPLMLKAWISGGLGADPAMTAQFVRRAFQAIGVKDTEGVVLSTQGQLDEKKAVALQQRTATLSHDHAETPFERGLMERYLKWLRRGRE